MDSDSIYRSISLIALIVGGGLLAGIETAYSSCNKIRLRTQAENDDHKAARVLAILEKPEQYITTILILLNVVHISAASIATVLAVGWIGELGSLASTIILTLLIFIFAEVIPKSIAKDNADALAVSAAPLLKFLIFILKPLAIVFSSIAGLLRKLLGRTPKEPTMTEDELQSIIETIEEEGIIQSDQSELIQSAIDFLDTTAKDILTPRVDIMGIDVDWRLDKIEEIILKEKYSRFPVYEDGIDNIIGVLQSRKYLKGMLNGTNRDIKSIMDQAVFVHESILLNTLFEMMSVKRVHMVIVTDDYGGTAGILTIEDIVEELVGDIFDEDDIVEEEYKLLEDGVYEVSAEMRMDELFDILDLPLNDDVIEHKTISAWMLEHLQNIPEVSDSFEDLGLHATIRTLDNMRIGKVRIEIVGQETEEGEDVL